MTNQIESTPIYFILGLISLIGLGCRPDNDPSPNGNANSLCQMSSIRDSATNSTDSVVYDGQGRAIKGINRGGESILEYYSNPSTVKISYTNSRDVRVQETYMMNLGRISGYTRSEPDSGRTINGIVQPGISFDTATFSYNGNGQIIYFRTARKEVYENPALIAGISISILNFGYQDGRVVQFTENRRENDGDNGSFRESTTTTKYVYDLTRPVVKANPVVRFGVYNLFGTSISNQIPTLAITKNQKIDGYSDPVTQDSTLYTAEINSNGYPIKISSTEYRNTNLSSKYVNYYRWKCN